MVRFAPPIGQNGNQFKHLRNKLQDLAKKLHRRLIDEGSKLHSVPIRTLSCSYLNVGWLSLTYPYCPTFPYIIGILPICGYICWYILWVFYHWKHFLCLPLGILAVVIECTFPWTHEYNWCMKLGAQHPHFPGWGCPSTLSTPLPAFLDFDVWNFRQKWFTCK